MTPRVLLTNQADARLATRLASERAGREHAELIELLDDTAAAAFLFGCCLRLAFDL